MCSTFAAVGGIAAVTLTDAATFVISAGLLTLVRTSGRTAARGPTGLITLFQRNSEDAYRGRIFGAISTLEGVTILAGTLGAGYLTRSAGIIGVLAIQGGAYVVAGLAMLAWLGDTPGTPAGGWPSVPEVAASQVANVPQA